MAGSQSTSSSHDDKTPRVPDPVTSLAAYLPALQTPLVSLTRNASSLPGPSDLAFHRSIDRGLAAEIDAQSQQVQKHIQQLTRWAKPKGKAKAATDDDEDDDESPTALYNRISDVIDGLLERADTCMDEYSGKAAPRNLDDDGGAGRGASSSSSSSNTRLTAPSTATTSRPILKNGKLPNEITNAQIDPPQRSFTVKPDNSPDEQWDRPLAMGKPNALVPLGWKPDESQFPPFEPGTVRQGMYCAEGDPRDNPYFYEIFNSKPPAFIYQPPSEAEMQPPPPLDEAVPAGVSGVPFTWIDTREGIQDLSSHLQESRVKEIAIDLEAHAYRSYQGIACLMQLSTRWGDYIIDLLSDEVRQSIEVLNNALTDPAKIKILHGAEHDVLWLQRDCGLYLVNLFDTYHATNVLPFPAHGLAFLLSKYYDFEADKRYQLADWRIRPLPKEMLYYARSDTHALIYIYHRLRLELLTAGGKVAMDEVMKRSQVTAARRYAKEVWDEEGNTREGWRSMWRRMGGDEARGTDSRLLPAQMNRTERLLRRLHLWRDRVARDEDESPRYILSAQNLLNLASRAPMTKSEAMACFSPGIPPVRKRAGEVARIIKEEVLAWEQDQSARQQAERAKLDGEVESVVAGGGDGEDVGVSAVVQPSSNAATPTVAAATNATTPQLPTPPIVASLWANGNGKGADGSIRRTQQSSLLGARAAHSTMPSPTSSSADTVQKSLLHSLRSIIGASAGAGGGSRAGGDGEGEGEGSAANGIAPSASTGNASEQQQQQSTTAAALVEPSQDTRQRAATQQSPSNGSNAVADADDANADDIVSVKKSKNGSAKKQKWSREQKRKARQDRSAEAEAGTASPPATKKAKTASTSTSTPLPDVVPYDYAAQPSILDNPTAALSSSSSTSTSKANKKKDKKKASAPSKPPANDPARFADRPAPRDRTEIKGAGRSFTFK